MENISIPKFPLLTQSIRMRIYFFLFCWAWVIPRLQGQDQVDSALKLLTRSTPATYRAAFQRLDSACLLSTPTSLPPRIKTIHQISKQLDFKGPQVAAYRIEAVIYKVNHRLPEALQAVAKACLLAQELALPLELADSYQEKGNLYAEVAQPDSALHYYLKASSLYEQQKHWKARGDLLYKVGNLFYQARQYETALAYLTQALKVEDSLHSRTRISILNTIGLIYRNQKSYQKAIEYHHRSLRLAQSAKDSAWIGINHGNIGYIFEKKGNYKKALEHFQHNLTLSRRSEIWGDVVTTLSSISRLNTLMHNFSAAKRSLNEAHQLAIQHKEFDDLEQVYNGYSKYYQQLGQYDSAFYYERLYYTTKDSIEQQHFNTQLEQIRSTFEFEKKQTQIELLQKNNQLIQTSIEKKNVWLLVAFILLGCTILFGFLLYRNNQQKHKTNLLLTEQQKELFEKNEEINQQNEEIKDLNNNLERLVEQRTQELQIAYDNLMKQNQNLEQFAYIVSHNLRAPIARILGLVSIMDQNPNGQPHSNSMLPYLNQATQNLDTIVKDLNDILVIRDQAHMIREQIHLEEVIASVLESLNVAITESKAQIQYDFSPVKQLVAIRSYLTSILYNLLSNAIKYRDPERPIKIKVASDRVDSYICLIVQDNGLGIDLTKPAAQKLFKLYHRLHFHTEGKGMGLFLVREQVEAINGKIEVESQPGIGTTFRVFLPA